MFRLDSIVTVVHKERDSVSTDCPLIVLSANNYTVNECEEAEGLCVVRLVSELNRWVRGQSILSEWKENESPRLFLQTPVVCVS